MEYRLKTGTAPMPDGFAIALVPEGVRVVAKHFAIRTSLLPHDAGEGLFFESYILDHDTHPLGDECDCKPIRHGHDSTKWYEHEDDVKRLSRMFPDVLFTLSGEGEENGDTWMFYCRNGQGTRVVPKVVWPDVDPSMVGPSASQADDPTKET